MRPWESVPAPAGGGGWAAGQHHGIVIARQPVGKRWACAVGHWMFDRGLVSLGDPPDYPILLSSDALPDSVRRLFNPDLLLRKPADQRFWPSPAYAEFHRSQVFKG